jgi:nucleotide-binding universal stress UspA family protein
MTLFKRIVVPIDGSDPSKRALSTALEIAKRFDSEVIVITVASVFHGRATYLENEKAKTTTSMSNKRKAYEVLAETEEAHHVELLKEAEVIANKEGVEIQTELLRGTPSEEIIEFLDEEAHDLIVMGCRGLGTMKELLLGSTSSAVLHHCNHTVVIVK